MKTCCGNCRFWDDNGLREDDVDSSPFAVMSHCLRRAPTLDRTGNRFGQFPLIAFGGWCGEHEPAGAASLTLRREQLSATFGSNVSI